MLKPSCPFLKTLFSTCRFSMRSHLKQRLYDVLPKKIEQFRTYRKKYSEYEIGTLTVNDVLNGCTNVPILFYEGSVQDSKTVNLLKFTFIKYYVPFRVFFSEAILSKILRTFSRKLTRKSLKHMSRCRRTWYGCS